MSGFVEGIDRSQSTFFPAMLDDYVAEDNLVRAVDAFVEGLDLGKLGFGRVAPLERGRPSYHPATLLKIYIYGYLNRVPSSRRLERECQRNIELVWLTGQLAPDFKTIADFRKDNGKAICEVCRSFVALCRELDLLSVASVAIDGSKFKAVNARDKNFTEAKMKRRLERIDESIARYMAQLETADRQGDAVPEAKVVRLKDKIAKLKEEVERLNAINAEMMESEDKQISLTDPDARSMATSGKDTGIVGYNVQTAVDTKNHLIVAHEVTNVQCRERTPSTTSAFTATAVSYGCAIRGETVFAIAAEVRALWQPSYRRRLDVLDESSQPRQAANPISIPIPTATAMVKSGRCLAWSPSRSRASLPARAPAWTASAPKLVASSSAACWPRRKRSVRSLRIGPIASTIWLAAVDTPEEARRPAILPMAPSSFSIARR
jgi:transposase